MDWIRLLDDNFIEFVTRGPNTKHGEVSVKCPFCGEEDPSQHLGISLTAEVWGCHRNGAHRGKKPEALIEALLGCGYSQARLIAAQYSRVDPDDLGGAIAALQATSEQPSEAVGPAIAPPQWRTIDPVGPTAKHWHYLAARGFDDVASLISRYSLKACLSGRWKDRVIIPFYQNRALLGWTARALVNPILAPRYLSSGEAVKTTVFNEDELRDGGDTLVLVEGPFDALKVDYYGAALGARATCVFGTSMTMDQVYILNSLRKRFQRVMILFDHDAVEPAFYASDWLQARNVVIGSLPKGTKDPGDLNKEQIEELLR